MKNIKMKRIAITVFKISIAALVFILTFLLTFVLSSDAEIKDVFSTKRVSCLGPRKCYAREIIVDASRIIDFGGIKTLTENILSIMAKKRPNWYFVIIVNQTASHDQFAGLLIYPNIKRILVKPSCNNMLQNVCNFFTCNAFKTKVSQLMQYNNIFYDDHVDLLWDPYAELAPNDVDVPKISTIHDLAHIDIPNCFAPDKREWAKTNMKSIVNNSKKIITVSYFSKRRIKEVYNKDNVDVISIRLAKRVNFTCPSHQQLQILQQFHLRRKNYIIYTSSFWPNKNHQRLIRAFDQFKRSNPSDLKLVIVGMFSHSQPLTNDITKITKEYHDVVFTDYVSSTTLGVLLHNALAFICPSIYEGFGMPIAEAMSMGIPVACSNVASLPEVAGNAAIFFDPFDCVDIARAIARITKNEALRNDLVQKGYQQVQKFLNQEKMVDQYIKIFEEVMGENT